jgi:hypothetical protein
MTKLALRVSRRFSKLRGRGGRATRPKTFSSEDKAKAWAEANGIKKYSLKNLKSAESSTKKIRVEVEE